MRSMAVWSAGLTVLIGGCGPYAAWQADLAAVARDGLRRVEASRAEASGVIGQYLDERRTRLDEAFDADVRDRGSLDAEWVISARRLYSAGIDRIAEARIAQREADRVAADNAVAADEALAALERTLRARARIWRLPKGR